MHRGMHALVVGDEATICCAGATHLILRLGTSVQTTASVAVVNVGIPTAPGVTGSDSVSVVVSTPCIRLSGQLARNSRSLSHSQNGSPQVGEPGLKTTSVQAMDAGIKPLAVVRVVLVTWVGQSE